jgi:hypothetical protein
MSSYFAHLNPLIWVLDKHLHTPAYCRQRSPLLFSAILLTSAKVIRPDLYQASLDHIDHLVGLAFQSGISTVELVQSLSILVFWRESDDSSSYGKIGHAIRTAYELKINLRRRPLPDDDYQARLRLVSWDSMRSVPASASES